jgi:periplasmic copper chaperone A
MPRIDLLSGRVPARRALARRALARPALARRAARAAAAASLVVLAAAGLTGCYTKASAAPAIELSTAVVPQPSASGKTVAFLVIRNNGGPDRLISARTSAGGRVTFGPEGNSAAHLLPAISIPGHNVIHLAPNSDHLLITGARPMHGGKDITLTLVFAHAGTISVIAQVTNPETGGSTYFEN